MQLKILAYEGTHHGALGSAPIGPRGCTFGRGSDNDLVLVDPERLVSRQQARVEAAGSGYTLVNVSSANSLLLNEVEVGPGESCAIVPGDQIRVGRFVIGLAEDRRAEDLAGGVATSPPTPASIPASPSDSAPTYDPLAVFDVSSPNEADPFADLIAQTPPRNAPAQPRDTPTHQVASTPPHQEPRSALTADAFDLFAGLDRPASEATPILPAVGTPDIASQDNVFRAPEPWVKQTHAPEASRDAANAFIPEDFDPFALPSLSRRNSDDPLANIEATHIDGLDDLLRDGRTVPENLLDDLPKPASEPLPDTARLASSGSILLDDAHPADPLALFGEASPFAMLDAHSEAITSMRDNTPEIGAAFELPRPTPAATVPVPPVPPSATTDTVPEAAAKPVHGQAEAPIANAQVAVAARTPPSGVVLPNPGGPLPTRGPSAQALAAELLVAFQRGAGMTDLPTQSLTPDFMRLLGELLAIVAQGTVDLMQARAATKHELRAEVTMIAPQANNPLKFAPDGQAAMSQLVGKRFPGFMPPIEAMRDAFDDLRAHQVGMTAGMRAALQEVLSRFAPDNLERRITQQSFLETVLPAARKSRLWDLYTEMYQQIKDEAEDEFHSLFGEAFLKTYAAEVERLGKREKP